MDPRADHHLRLVVVGGDSTLSHAAGLLAGTGTGLGVLPLETGNTFARSVGVPLDLPGAARLAGGGRAGAAGAPGTSPGPDVGGGRARLRTHQLLVANGRYVAGPLRAAPGASVADRQLDVLDFGDGRLLSLLRVGLGWAAAGAAAHGGAGEGHEPGRPRVGGRGRRNAAGHRPVPHRRPTRPDGRGAGRLRRAPGVSRRRGAWERA
ncbi:diacylglycerol kinase family protein [Deinococcus aetherius]|uniref:diacylglycerol kinase family protein n=1 Tax=Deinococcus aetherius TaxID=200252 RepID=UPI00222E25F7|nr:diacylglycerol kinase family protein [Deinococcus aetherius]